MPVWAPARLLTRAQVRWCCCHWPRPPLRPPFFLSRPFPLAVQPCSPPSSPAASPAPLARGPAVRCGARDVAHALVKRYLELHDCNDGGGEQHTQALVGWGASAAAAWDRPPDEPLAFPCEVPAHPQLSNPWAGDSLEEARHAHQHARPYTVRALHTSFSPCLPTPHLPISVAVPRRPSSCRTS
jgi:hypothetical protein